MPKTSQLSTFDEADAALRVLGEAQRELAQLELDCQARMDAAKKRLAEARIGADAVIRSTTRLLTKFVETHQEKIEERGGGRTVRLAFGRIGMRTAPPVLRFDKGFTEADAVVWLKRHFPKDAAAYIRVTEKLDREELKLWDDEKLAQIGARVEQDQIVVIEPAQDVAQAVVA